MEVVLWSVLFYLYGALPFGYIATYLIKQKKLSEEGTGNIGVTNTFKVGGTAAGIITVLGEISKALIPIAVAWRMFPGDLITPLLFFSCSLTGTSFSVFLRGKGGKGSTVGFWGLALLSPYSFIILITTWIILSLLARGNVLIKKLQLLCIPCAICIVERTMLFTCFGLLASLLLFFNSYTRKDDFAYYNIFRQRSEIKDAD